MPRICKPKKTNRKKPKPEKVEEKVEEEISDVEQTEVGWENLEEYYSDSLFKVEPVLSRTSLLLLDYRQFKAARRIQTAYRGSMVRRRLAKENAAATVIQREWRRFYAMRYCYRLLEAKVQAAIEAYYYRCAQIIQALWRGWWVRHNVHNQIKLSRFQAFAAEDLLNCVAFKLHHLLRTRQIPGVFSIRNSNCLSKVEKLLAAMTFKQYNERIRAARDKRDALIHAAKMTFEESPFKTRVPYIGPNTSGICEPKCCEIYREENADRRMYKILSLYDKASRQEARMARLNKRKHDRKMAEHRKLMEVYHKNKGEFCSDVVDSMRRWRILQDNKLTVDPDVFKHPENVKSFLTEVQSLYSLLKGSCNCHRGLDQPSDDLLM